MKRGIIPASLHGMTEVEVYPQVSAKAQMETTKMQYESRKKLAEKKIVSDYVLSTAHNAYQVALAAVQQAEAQLAIAKTNLGYCTVTAPISGTIKENGTKWW